MELYPTIFTIHIVFAGTWLINLAVDYLLRSQISKNRNNIHESKLVSLYLLIVNLIGSIGAGGILLTGIILVGMNPGYGFFDMSANHWLASKQILMVILLIVLGAFLIPTAKKIRVDIEKEIGGQNNLSDEALRNLRKLYKLNTTINIIVILNFLFAITHRYLG